MSTKTKGPNINIHDGDNAQSGRIIHIERLLIDGSSKVPSDGIRIHAPKAMVQLKLDRFVGFWGTLSGYHADVVQPAGGVKELRIDGLTGSSHYNDFYLRRENNPLMPAIGKVTIRNTEHVRLHQQHDPAPDDPRYRHRHAGKPALGRQPEDQLRGHQPDHPRQLLDHATTGPSHRPVRVAAHPHGRPGQLVRSRYNSSTHTMNWPTCRATRAGRCTAPPTSALTRLRPVGRRWSQLPLTPAEAGAMARMAGMGREKTTRSSRRCLRRTSSKRSKRSDSGCTGTRGCRSTGATPGPRRGA